MINDSSALRAPTGAAGHQLSTAARLTEGQIRLANQKSVSKRRAHRLDGIRRRDLLALAAGATLAMPLAAHAQRKRNAVIGLLTAGSAAGSLLDKMREGLREAGFVNDQDLAIEYRQAEGRYDELPKLAAELVGKKVDVIVTSGGTPAALAAKSATSTIPIVFAFVSDPVGAGLVASLAQPGGNVTGFSNVAIDLMSKRVGLLCDLVPQAKQIGLLVNPRNPTAEPLIRDAQTAAGAKGVALRVVKASADDEIETAFATLVQQQASGLLVDADVFVSSRSEQIIRLASRYAIPAIYAFRFIAVAGGLISYGNDNDAVMREVGIYVGKILRGAKPAELPIQQPTTFHLVINLKTAKALGLAVPQALLAQADEVIE